jgi:hypothetical protein
MRKACPNQKIPNRIMKNKGRIIANSAISEAPVLRARRAQVVNRRRIAIAPSIL